MPSVPMRDVLHGKPTWRSALVSPLSERAWAWICVAPALALLSLFAALPILHAVWLSLHAKLPIFGIDRFIGLENYRALMQDDRMGAAFGTTLYFTLVSVALEVVLGLGIALLVYGRLVSSTTGAARPVLRVIMLIPWAIPSVVSARIWEWLYQPDYGVLNYVLAAAGMIHAPIYWLGTPGWALHAAILMDVWKTTPFAAVILSAGLHTIPQELYRAAVVDGASPWLLFRHITLPLLWPAILIVLTFRTMDAFRVFDAVFVLTAGGPGNGTETLSIYAYKTLFHTLQFGYGSAITTAMFLVVSGMTMLYLLILRRRLEVL